MKKIALVLAAVAALGVAGCKKTADVDANNTVDINATVNAANADVNAAANEADTGNAVTATENAAGNAAMATGNAVETGADAVANTAHNATH